MGLDADVTLRSLSLGSRDSTTGHRLPSYSESTIKAVGTPQGGHFNIQGVGVYAREDRMFTAASPANVGDQIKEGTRYYEVKTKQQFKLLDSHLFYAYQCHELPLWQGAVETATWKTSPNDPRERTKTWLDTHVDADHNWITKNDNSALASWACAFKPLPYPMELEFRAPSAPVQGLYVIGQPTSELKLGVRYMEYVPISIYTVDSEDCAGDPLSWKMEAELRYVAENKPHGSLRTLETRSGEVINLGSTQLYHIPTVLNYRRTSERGVA